MNISEIKIGTLLEIYIKRDGYNYKVVSKVEYVDENRVGVTPIASRTKLFRFKTSDVVDIVYNCENKSWKWAKVRAGIATLQDGTKLHVFEAESTSEVFNRRSTYRLPMGENIIISYEVMEYNELSEEKLLNSKTPELAIDKALSKITESYREYTSHAFLRDISEGGASIYTDAPLKKGDIVNFELPYGEDTVKCRAIVIRVRKSDKEEHKANYGLNYIETSNNYVSYFYATQRRMLSEGKTDYFA